MKTALLLTLSLLAVPAIAGERIPKGAIVLLEGSLAFEVDSRRVCHTQDGYPRAVECSYSAGKDTVINIAGVGREDVSVTFEKTNQNGDSYAKFQVAIGCVLIKRGLPLQKDFASLSDMAFISPVTGKVYPNVEGCRAANGK